MGNWQQSGSVHLPALILSSFLLLAGSLLPPQLMPPGELRAARSEVARLQADVASLSQDTLELEAALDASDPEEIYVVVDTQANLLYVYRGDTALRVAVVSTGSGKVLHDPAGARWWSFESPSGVRRVLRKTENPVWYKPDWAFIEEGLAVPPRHDPSRVVRGILGAYALDLGDQVKIHGTTETDRLGEPVSHGCVRVGDGDLEFIHLTVPVDARVFFY
ncbi:MAG: L,D-transpeptidase family protein [Acidobacteria bacterium]|nr:L,D-transpeptidase family protein [Acidobacteriota bacterium]